MRTHLHTSSLLNYGLIKVNRYNDLFYEIPIEKNKKINIRVDPFAKNEARMFLVIYRNEANDNALRIGEGGVDLMNVDYEYHDMAR